MDFRKDWASRSDQGDRRQKIRKDKAPAQASRTQWVAWPLKISNFERPHMKRMEARVTRTIKSGTQTKRDPLGSKGQRSWITPLSLMPAPIMAPAPPTSVKVATVLFRLFPSRFLRSLICHSFSEVLERY